MAMITCHMIISRETGQLLLTYQFKLIRFFQTELDQIKLDHKVLLLWIIYVISVLFCYALMHVCLLMPCGHLLGKG